MYCNNLHFYLSCFIDKTKHKITDPDNIGRLMLKALYNIIAPIVETIFKVGIQNLRLSVTMWLFVFRQGISVESFLHEGCLLVNALS